MSYAPSTDFLGLLRQTSGGVRAERMPGLDYVVSALSRAGFFQVSVSATAPTINQATTAWFRPGVPSWNSEGTLFLWNSTTIEYEVATPALWAAMLGTTNVIAVQEILTPGPVNVRTDAHIVLVNQIVSAPITLVVPLSTTKSGDVLISDWKGDSGNGNTITINLTGTDVFPGGLTSWQIAGNGASVLLKVIPGRGYAT